MAASHSVNDAADLDVDHFPKLSASAQWLTVDPDHLSFSAYVLQNNMAAMGNRQDMYYQLAIKKFLRYQATSRSGRSASATPAASETRSNKTKKAPVSVDASIEEEIENRWQDLRKIVTDFEKAGNTIYMRRTKKTGGASMAFLSFLKHRVQQADHPLQPLLAKLEVCDNEQQHAVFIQIGTKAKKGQTVEKTKGRKRTNQEDEDDEEGFAEVADLEADGDEEFTLG